MSFQDAIMRVLADPLMRRKIYGHERKLLPFTGSRCATHVSLAYWAAKGVDIGKLRLGDVWPGTDNLARFLTAHGWHKTTDMDDLTPGMILFSQDRAGRKGAPDHVYFFIRWHDKAKRIAVISDNNKATLYTRNLGPGPRTPFAYALYPPV